MPTPTDESLFEAYWTNVYSTLTNTLSKVSGKYSQEDFNNAIKRAEIAQTLAADYEHFANKASELSRKADQAGVELRKSAQNALDSASIMFRQQADALHAKGLDALEKVNLDVLSGINRQFLATAGEVLGPVGDTLDIAMKASEGDYYAAAGSFVGAVAGAAAAAVLVGLTGWISIPLAVGFGWLAGESFEDIFKYLDPLNMSPNVNSEFQAANSFVERRDPLSLDLGSVRKVLP